VARAVDQGQPVTTRTLTVSGAVARPATFTVPLGTPLREVLEKAGGATIANPAYMEGGPIMGKVLDDLDQPVTKTTSGLLVFPDTHRLIVNQRTPMERILQIARTTCDQCALCTDLCPRHLIGHELPPHLIVRAVNQGDAKPSIPLSALTCSECAICELYACPCDISPMRLNKALKAKFRAEGMRYVGELGPADEMAEYRLIPSKKMAARIAVDPYVLPAPLDESSWMPARVVLPLQQHVGKPAQALVAPGERVRAGQLLAHMPDGQLGAAIHASVAGTVESISASAITLRT
ncbi:MAG: SLBB domain-containing protein, partial [Paucibacter sp.]|nr:SLBB domain-containing protein [Roseateles sp.]